jgi:2-hydroxychromene-2-carboxylate isomerase
VDDVNISDLGAVLDIAAGVGVDRDVLSAVLAGTEIKARLAAEVDLGLARGVFGSPFIIRRRRSLLGRRPAAAGRALAGRGRVLSAPAFP